MVRRASIRGLAVAAVFLVALMPGRATAYIDIPPATLGRMCESTMSITLVRVEEIDSKRGRVIFRAVRDLKGNGPSDLVKHAVGTKAGGGKEVLAWAKKGTQAVHFASASRGYSYTYIDGHWYSATLSDGWWHLARSEPLLLRGYCGTAAELVAAVESIVAGKEVVVPCLVGEKAEDLKPASARVRRLKASLKRTDFNLKRDFVGWGSAEGAVVANDKRGLVIKVAGKERTVPLPGVALLDKEGKALGKERIAKAFESGAQVEITERGGKVAEVRLQ